MPYADHLIPTCVPGLCLTRGGTDVLHLFSNLTVLTLSAELSREERTGLTEQSGLIMTFPGVLSALSVLDWTAQLTPTHAALLSRLASQLRDPVQARRLHARTLRIMDGAQTLVSFFQGTRGSQLWTWQQEELAAREARETARTPGEKAAATRAEKALAARLEAGGITHSQLRALGGERPVHHLLRGMQRMRSQRRAWETERQRRRGQGSLIVRATLGGQHERLEVLTHIEHLRVCLCLSHGHDDLHQAERDRRGLCRERRTHELRDANRERVRRVQGGLLLDSSDPQVRAATRQSRIRQGRWLLRAQYQRGQNPHGVLLHELALALRQASRFKGAAVRCKHLAPITRRLRDVYGHRAGIAMRGVWGFALADAERYRDALMSREEAGVQPRWQEGPRRLF